jgi:hypothetical protein
MSNMLLILFPSPSKGANQTSSPEKAHESMANEKNPPNSELECPQKTQPSPEQRATGFRALLHFSSCSLSFLSNKSYFIHQLWLIIQLPHKSVPWPVKARTLTLAHNTYFITPDQISKEKNDRNAKNTEPPLDIPFQRWSST